MTTVIHELVNAVLTDPLMYSFPAEYGGGGLSVAEEKILKELMFFVERSDITEETTRLASHLDQLHALFNTEGAIGRKIDFLIQEMVREINTIGSKANDKDIAHQVVEFKTELERIREQVQNIE